MDAETKQGLKAPSARPPIITAKERKKLAREARKLAMECVEGTAPEFTVNSFCGCGVGVLIERALPARHVADYTSDSPYYKLACAIDEHLPAPNGLGLVSRELQDHGPEGLPFPLLALADALDEASGNAP